jgi:hypothetical protein
VILKGVLKADDADERVFGALAAHHAADFLFDWGQDAHESIITYQGIPNVWCDAIAKPINREIKKRRCRQQSHVEPGLTKMLEIHSGKRRQYR